MRGLFMLSVALLALASGANADSSDFEAIDDLCQNEGLLYAASVASNTFCEEVLVMAVPSVECSKISFEVVRASSKIDGGTQFQHTLALADDTGKCLIAFQGNTFVPWSYSDEEATIDMDTLEAMACTEIDYKGQCNTALTAEVSAPNQSDDQEEEGEEGEGEEQATKDSEQEGDEEESAFEENVTEGTEQEGELEEGAGEYQVTEDTEQEGDGEEQVTESSSEQNTEGEEQVEEVSEQGAEVEESNEKDGEMGMDSPESEAKESTESLPDTESGNSTTFAAVKETEANDEDSLIDWDEGADFSESNEVDETDFTASESLIYQADLITPPSKAPSKYVADEDSESLLTTEEDTANEDQDQVTSEEKTTEEVATEEETAEGETSAPIEVKEEVKDGEVAADLVAALENEVEEIETEQVEDEEDESSWKFAGRIDECSRFGWSPSEGIVFLCDNTAYVCGDDSEFKERFMLLHEDHTVDGCDMGEVTEVFSSKVDCNYFPKNEHYLKRDGTQKEGHHLFCPNGATLSSYYMFCTQEMDNYYCDGQDCETCAGTSRQRRKRRFLRN